MQIERLRPTAFQITIHPFELAALVSAARWVAEGTPGELTDEALTQLRQVLANYEVASRRMAQAGNQQEAGEQAA
jgi:hypothetical protein